MRHNPVLVRIRLLMSLILFGVIFCAFNCAYLNTFYNAKTAFIRAYNAQMALKKRHADTTEVLPDNIRNGYERAITKSRKLLEEHPKDKKWHDDATFLIGKAAFYKREYERAIKYLKQFQNSFPQSPFMPESYLLLGKAYLQNDQLDQAEQTFTYALANYPKLNTDEEITVWMAQVSIKREGKSQAIQILERVIDSVSTDEKKLEITSELSKLYIDLKMYNKAITLLLKAPRNMKYSQFLYQIDLSLIRCYRFTFQYEKCLQLVNSMLNSKEYVAYQYAVLLEKGLLYKDQNKNESAKKTFEQITKSKTNASIIARAWYELGLLQQHIFGDFVFAKSCYHRADSITIDEWIRQECRQRIKGIDETTAFASQIASNTSKSRTYSGKNDSNAINKDSLQYRLAETYWLSLSEPDSALKQYSAITTDSLADSVMIMKALYAKAWILQHVKKDSLSSDSIYRTLIKRYPNSLVAQKSQQDLGLPITVQTRQDSASLEMIAAERLYFENQNPVDAVNAYYRVSKKYWDVKDIAVSSLYAAAWLCDYVLSKNTKAFELYKMLCDSFPESEACNSLTKQRIKIVEDTMRIISVRNKNNPREKQKALQNIVKDTL